MVSEKEIMDKYKNGRLYEFSKISRVDGELRTIKFRITYTRRLKVRLFFSRCSYARDYFSVQVAESLFEKLGKSGYWGDFYNKLGEIDWEKLKTYIFEIHDKNKEILREHIFESERFQRSKAFAEVTEENISDFFDTIRNKYVEYLQKNSNNRDENFSNLIKAVAETMQKTTIEVSNKRRPRLLMAIYNFNKNAVTIFSNTMEMGGGVIASTIIHELTHIFYNGHGADFHNINRLLHKHIGVSYKDFATKIDDHEYNDGEDKSRTIVV